MRNESIATQLGSLSVQISGSGPAVVCWPSLMMTGSMWSDLAAQLAHRYTLVLIDPPGHGLSSSLGRTFTLEECALCLMQVLDGLALRECFVLGSSWGGMVGSMFLALYPSSALGAVLLNTTASQPTVLTRLESKVQVALAHKLAGIPKRMLPHVVKRLVGPTTENNRPEVVQNIRHALEQVDMRSVAWALRSVVGERRDQHALLNAIRAPVLVIAGEEDREFSVAEARRMASAIPGSQLLTLANVGHSAVLEAPEHVHAVVAEFLESVSSHANTHLSVI